MHHRFLYINYFYYYKYIDSEKQKSINNGQKLLLNKLLYLNKYIFTTKFQSVPHFNP